MTRVGCPLREAQGRGRAPVAGGLHKDPPAQAGRITESGAQQVLSRVVKAWLIRSGDPLKVAASRLGVGISTVCQWSGGKRFPRPAELDALAECFGVPVACLFCPVFASDLEHNTGWHSAESDKDQLTV